jgi:2-keto-4-pentenoate hydratase/2-oxohepta-3-ene-1,7-dioic acid hydratase in catechol pathway
MRYARILYSGAGASAFCRIEGKVAHVLDGAPWAGGRPTGEVRPWTDAELDVPVAPGKIVCIGRNYAAHAKELGNEAPKEPLLFFKPQSSLLRPGGQIVLPWQSERVEHEAELGVVIGTRARNVRREAAMAHVFGYTCVADVTARDLQKKDGQWARAKGFDTFCPVGPWIETEVDPAALRVACRVGGQTKQDGSTKDMIFDVASLVAFISEAMTLEPGDLISTGTPDGVGPLAPGDALEVEVSGIGVLRATVAPERARPPRGA